MREETAVWYLLPPWQGVCCITWLVLGLAASSALSNAAVPPRLGAPVLGAVRVCRER